MTRYLLPCDLKFLNSAMNTSQREGVMMAFHALIANPTEGHYRIIMTLLDEIDEKVSRFDPLSEEEEQRLNSMMS